MKQINPHAKMALLLGLFLGGVVFTVIYLLTEGERIIVASIFSLVPLVLLLCLVGNFFDPGPPE
jgi:hypothetical protein